MSTQWRSGGSQRVLLPAELELREVDPARRVAAVLPRFLAAWHLLSLDAPTVAALWVTLVAHSAALTLPWTDPAATFLAVWLLYAADRLLDTRGLRAAPARQGLEARHHFHFRNRRRFGLALLLACPLLLRLLQFMDGAELRLNFLLGALLLAWLLLIHGRLVGALPPTRLPKELAVGIFFPAAIFIPTIARLPGLRFALLPEAVLFAATCSLNCLFIYAWEHPSSRAAAHWTTAGVVHRLVPLGYAAFASAVLLAALWMAFGLLHLTTHALFVLPALACAASIGLLLLLHRERNNLGPVTLRAAADLCLLTPALLLPFSRFHAR